MRFKILALLAFITLCWLPLPANAATYNWYFSDDAMGNAVGNDTTGNGSVSRPWKTLSKAQNQINTLGFGDTANLYFDRGDTWTESTGRTQYHFMVRSNGPKVNIDAYGSGDKPVFDGSISYFSTAPDENSKDSGSTYYRYYRFFDFRRSHCSISNVEIKNVYGGAIFLYDGDDFTLSNSEIHNVGGSAISGRIQNGVEDCLVEYNKIYLCQQLNRYGKISPTMWGAALSFFAGSGGAMYKNNTVRHNLVYDIAGEGIAAPNSVIEYNVVGDTSSIAIDTAAHGFDTLNAVVRYNLVIMRDWGSSPYDNLQGGPHGIRIYDEAIGGTNSAANISVYGNIVINRSNGIQVFSSLDNDNPFGSVKIYNNLVIDSHTANIRLADPDEFTSLKFYNNSSILYDRTWVKHANMVTPGSGWDIGYNHFWTKGGSPNVPSAFQANHVTTDPKLPGEPALDWDGLIGANYIHKIDFGNHLYISPDSGLANAGKILGSGYNNRFLTAGTDFSNFKFQRKSQPDSSKWCIGPIIPNGISIEPNIIPPPSDLTISFISN